MANSIGNNSYANRCGFNNFSYLSYVRFYTKEVTEMALKPKQRKALELLTCGLGLSYEEIARRCEITPKTLWSWRNSKEFTEFQDELARLNTIRWQAAEDAAREACVSLCRKKKKKMVEFVLKNAGYNPTTKVEAEVHSDINIEIDE